MFPCESLHEAPTKDAGKKEINPTASKQLNHPVDILGLYRGVEGGVGRRLGWGVSAVVFCTTDSLCTHGGLLSLDCVRFHG